MLSVEALDTRYGDSQVLFGMELEVAKGEVATLLGRNGMGKTTTVRSIMGLTPPAAGRVVFAGRDLTGLPPHRVAQAGIGLGPEGRQIFPNLTGRENLVATARPPRDEAAEPWTEARIYELFPVLRARASNTGRQLSGGEQQMLAIARALMTNPRLLILDEATEGLAPMVRAEIWRVLAALKDAGLSILIIDKNVEALTRLADRHTIVERGRPVWRGSSAELAADPALKERYLGV